MRAPIFIDENGDLLAYDAVGDAERDLEAVDVKEGRYAGFAADGVPLDISVTRLAGGRLGVAISSGSGGVAEDSLRLLLEARLREIGVVATGLELADLVGLASKHFRRL